MHKGWTVTAAAVLAAFSVTGCTPLPTKVAPKPVPVAGYESMPCGELMTAYSSAAQQLQTADSAQLAARRSDAWGIVLLGLPLGRMSGGNHADQIAELKGETIAIGSAYKGKRCPGLLPATDVQ